MYTYGSCYKNKLKTILAPKMRVKDPKRPNLNLFAYLPTRGVRGKFSEGAKTFFLLFFLRTKCLFPVENFLFGRPKTNFRGFEKWQKSDVLSSFCNFASFIFNFPPSLFQFSFFSSPFSLTSPFFPCLSFPGRSAEISWSEVSGGGGALFPWPPPPLRHCCQPKQPCTKTAS